MADPNDINAPIDLAIENAKQKAEQEKALQQAKKDAAEQAKKDMQ
jgi:hypothetical protein